MSDAQDAAKPRSGSTAAALLDTAVKPVSHSTATEVLVSPTKHNSSFTAAKPLDKDACFSGTAVTETAAKPADARDCTEASDIAICCQDTLATAAAGPSASRVADTSTAPHQCTAAARHPEGPALSADQQSISAAPLCALQGSGSERSVMPVSASAKVSRSGSAAVGRNSVLGGSSEHASCALDGSLTDHACHANETWPQVNLLCSVRAHSCSGESGPFAVRHTSGFDASAAGKCTSAGVKAALGTLKRGADEGAAAAGEKRARHTEQGPVPSVATQDAVDSAASPQKDDNEPQSRHKESAWCASNLTRRSLLPFFFWATRTFCIRSGRMWKPSMCSPGL
jgi:hypothetical protein